MKPSERASLYQQSIRSVAVETLGGKCSGCGEKDGLHIHHKDGDVTNNKKENLDLLCKRCHSVEHDRDLSFTRRKHNLPMVRTTIYIKRETLKHFKKVCMREGVSMSAKFNDLAFRYSLTHREGNPQLPLEHFIGKTLNMCYFCEGHFPTLKKTKYVSGLIAPSCDHCIKDNERTLVKVMGVWTRHDRVQHRKVQTQRR